MDARRVPRTVPKVRHVGFFAPNDQPVQPIRTQSGPPGSSSPPLSGSPVSNSLSPVMIPPPRHLSDNFTSRVTAAVPVPDSGYRRPNGRNSVTVGSYNTSESLLRNEEFSEDAASSQGPGWFSRSDSTKFASSFPGGGFDLTSLKSSSEAKAATARPVEVNKPVGGPEKSGGTVAGVKDELSSSSKPVKAKTTRAERRALQESQRAAKASGKVDGNKSAAVSKAAASGKPAKQPPQRKEGPPAASSVAASENKGVDRPPERERKKDAPPPRMQFDDKNRVEKAKRRAVVNQTDARNRVELFRHLPQYEWGTQLPDLESKFFQLDPMHPAVYKVGLQYLAGDISGGNARCIAMLQAFQEAIRDYSTPTEKTLVRDVTAKISSYVSFLIECQPLSMSMGNAIRFLKSRIAKLPLNLSESEAKAVLCSEIDRFINEKIVLADKVIVRHAATKIRDGDVLLTHGSSCVVEMILLYAHELGKQFRVVIVDSHPKLEGQALLRRLVAKGMSCTYTHINAVSYIMHEVTRVFLGASSVLANGTVYSRIGTSCVAMVAHAFHIPVLICCEAYKFHERVLLDSICSNELGDPDAIAKIHGRTDVNYLDDLSNTENLQLLNLLYDATPSDYISMIITDYGMIPPTSVPVIVREYSGEHLWM
ncbi:translation initiation factor eIF-2B subunit delta-like isoform X2 [Tripterygium wilfordii]|uniref:translation initiation factor eIF-2B subunit delta-like isoform X2 n=1 Tax=Tripterygium wilfordii TaxID=458696 RepID=UPI0018F7EBAA|nr:translation initiation factor eIF-2B subunit delta-like isoform X2 [Tripterygium wilfordii]